MTVVKTIGQPDAESNDPPYIYVEVEGGAPATAWDNDVVRDTRAEKVLAAARDLLGGGVELARACATRFSGGLAQLPDGVTAPAEVELQIGITLDAELGAVLAKTKGGAQLQITMKWT